MKTKLIAISGIDGSGKSSIISSLARKLENQGYKVLITDAMQPCNYFRNLKEASKRLNMKVWDVFGATLPNICYVADLHESINKNILPNIDIYDYIIIHRYDLCCRAYSMLNDCDMNLIDSLLMGIPKPDFHFYLDVDIEVALKRIEIRSKIKSEKENFITLSNAIQNYKKLFNKYNDIFIIDNNDTLDACINVIEEILQEEKY